MIGEKTPTFLERPTIQRREWWLVAVVAVVVCAWSLYPTLSGVRRAPAGEQFLYSNIPDTSDMQIYYAFIDQNAQGHVFYSNLFTGESQRPVLFNPLWLVLGGAERLLAVAPTTIFTVARMIGGLALVAMLYFVISSFITQPRWRALGLMVAVFGAGLGGIILLIHHTDPRLVWMQTQTPLLRSLPADITYATAFTWLTIGHSPLFEVSQLLLLGSWWLLWRGARLRWIAIMIGVLAFVHPYDLVLFFGVIATHTIAGIITSQLDQATVRAYLRRVVWIATATLPAVAYYLTAMWLEPVIRQWFNQNILYSPALISFVAGFGALGILAIVGGRHHLRSASGLLAVSWAAGCFALSYFPIIPFQAKMLSTINIPLAILAIWGVRHLAQSPWWQARRWFGLSLGIAATALTFSTVVIFPVRMVRAQPIEPVYHFVSNDILSALTRLRNNSPEHSVVLGDYFTGNLVPQFAQRATYLGHNIQTINYLYKIALIRKWFFSDNLNQAEKKKFLRDNHINFVIEGPNERRWGNFDPTQLTNLEPVYHNSTVAIYAVK